MTMRKATVGLSMGLLLALTMVPAQALPGRPQYESSDPARGEMAHEVDEVSITFDEPLDINSSELFVSVCDQDVTSSTPHFPDPRTIAVDVEGGEPGTYVASYSVSGLDDTPQERSDPAEGTVKFALHTRSCDDGGGGGHNGHGNGNGGGSNHKGGHGGHGGRKHDGGHMGHNGEGGGSHDDHDSTGGTHDTHSGGKHSDGTHKGGHAGGDGDHSKKHEGKHHQKGHGGGHGDHGDQGSAGNGGDRPTAAPEGPSRPNPALNLALVLLLPALVGLVGGRTLRARAT